MSLTNDAVAREPELAREALARAQRAVDLTAASLKERATVGGRVSSDKLDEHQQVCFDTALDAAETTAARFVLDYAAHARDRLGARGGGAGLLLEERLALLYAAEALQSARNRRAARLVDFGMTPELFAETLDHVSVRAFCTEQLAVGRMEELGGLILARGGAVGAYLLDEQHEMFRTEFRKFATDVVMPLAEEVHRHDRLIPDEILQPLTELGVFGLSIPERFGGLQPDDGEDSLGMIVVTEELSRGSLGAAGSLITRPEIMARSLLAGGTDEQRQAWLPRLASGEVLAGVAVTEPDYGSDVAGMKCKAVKVDGGWVINGAKSWCTFGGKAHLLLVLARTDPDLAKGHRGLSLFLVEKPSFEGHDFEVKQETGGVMSGRAIATIGYRGMHSYDVFFDDWFVPETALVGGEKGLGKGFYFTMSGFAGGRIQTAARAIGVMQAAFEKAVGYVQERKVFGKLLGDYQLTKTRLARMGAALATSRQFTYGVGRLMDRGEGQMEASMVKFFTCRQAEWLTRDAMQLHGGMGYAEETAASRYFVDARVLSIFEGAEEVLGLKVIARALVDKA
jgi:(2S)-methylsuccinyl-CoA dehydrogenase